MNDKIETLFKDARINFCKKGQILVGPDEVSRGVHFIHAGYVKTYDIGPEGNSQVIAISGPNEIFPLVWALEDEERHLFYEAMCPVRFSTIPREVFRKKIESNEELLKEQLQTVLLSFRSYRQRIQNLNMKTTVEKVAFHLLFLGTNFGHKQGSSIQIDVPVTYQDLADSLNLTRETVNRVMTNFIKGGVLKKSLGKIVICDHQKLLSFLGDEITLNI